jgi:hypothetical protein
MLLRINLCAVALAAALATAVPACAQDALASEVQIDNYGNITAWSSTQIDFNDFMDGLEAYVYGELTGPNGEIAYGDAYDDGTGYAEVDFTGFTNNDGGQGSYYETGDSYEVWQEETTLGFYLGESQGSAYWDGTGCPFPTYELTSTNGLYYGGLYIGLYTATVGDDIQSSFYGRNVYELWGGGSVFSTCPDNTNMYSKLDGTQIQVGVDGVAQGAGPQQYIDVVGLPFWAVQQAWDEGPIPCGFQVVQQMWMTCPAGGPDYNYQTNVLVGQATQDFEEDGREGVMIYAYN